MGPKRKNSPKKNTLEGKYANYFKVGHNAFEFVFDFGQYYSETQAAELYTRIITSPMYAKTLAEMLHQAIEKYEEKYGPISQKD